MAEFMRVEGLKVYQKLCQLPIEVCELARSWPSVERFELASQVVEQLATQPCRKAQ